MKYFGISDCLACFKWLLINDIPVLEKEFKEYIGVKYAIATNFGRTALYLGLKSMKVAGGEVILPSFTCTVVWQAVILAGATPRFVDIQFGSFDLDLEDLARKITSSTRAIVLTHYFGSVAGNLEEIVGICRKNGIFIIEDCAHSLGAEYKGQKLGSFGDFAIFSLTKGFVNFNGGFFVTNNENLYVNAKRIMENEKTSLKRKVIDFPLVISDGLQQMVDKLLLDRVKYYPFKYNLIKLPDFIINKPRRIIILFLKKIISCISLFENSDRSCVNNHNYLSNGSNVEVNPYTLEISRLNASVARSQLNRINKIIYERKVIHDKIYSHLLLACKMPNCNFVTNVYTNIVIHVKKGNIDEIISLCKKRGLLLRKTWPTKQKLFDEQKTKTVTKIGKEMLTWNVNPSLTESEILILLDTVNNINGGER